MTQPCTPPCAPPGALQLDWSQATLATTLEQVWPGMRLEVQRSLGSTNTELLDRGRRGDAQPCLLVAEHQSAGRGRLGRLWASAGHEDPLASLTCSFGVALAPADWSGLSLAVGVALADALGERVQLKWPNDLWLMDAAGQGHKLAGILVETVAAAPGVPRQVVVGMGINVRPMAVSEAEAAEPGAARAASTLETASGAATAASYATLIATSGIPQAPRAEMAAPPWPKPGRAHVSQWWPQATPPQVLQAIVVPVLSALRRFEQEGFAAFAAAYAARDLLAGRVVQLLGPGVGQPVPAPPTGRARGVDDSGRLLVDTVGGLRVITGGEVSVRPC